MVVVSVFVNPAQFNERSDLERYPRQDERDGALAGAAGADLLFAPSVEEVYPPGFATAVEVLGLTRQARGRRARRRALPRRGHRRHEAAVHGDARRRLLRPEGRRSRRRHPPPGRGSEPAGADRGLSNRARARRTGDVEPQRAALRRAARPRARAARGARRGLDGSPRRASAPAALFLTPRARRCGRSASSPSTWRSSIPRRSSRVEELARDALLAVAARIDEVRLIDNAMLQPAVISIRGPTALKKGDRLKCNA